MCCCRVAVRPAVKRTCVRGSASSPAGGGVLSLTRVAIHAASPEGAGFPTRRCELTTHFLSALSKILDLFLFIKTIFFYKLIHSCFFKGEFLFEELKIRRVRSKRSPLRNIWRKQLCFGFGPTLLWSGHAGLWFPPLLHDRCKNSHHALLAALGPGSERAELCCKTLNIKVSLAPIPCSGCKADFVIHPDP